MAKNDYRRHQRQVSFVIDDDLLARFKSRLAREFPGMTVTYYLTESMASFIESTERPPVKVTSVSGFDPDEEQIAVSTDPPLKAPLDISSPPF